MDTEAPALISSIPPDKSINFHNNSIELVFDEWIKQNDLKQQLIITPYTENEYKISIKKNKLLLEFKEPFDSNTTYTFYFRGGIKDITEANLSNNLTLAFSTGSYIDSASIEGKVTDLMTNIPVNDVIVALYDAKDTTHIKTGKPLYFTKTNEEGVYKLENLKKMSYEMYALSDKNSNLIYDQRIEKVGYLINEIADSALSGSFDTSHQFKQDIQIFQLDDEPPIFVRKHSENGNYKIEFNEGIKTLKLALKEPGIKPALIHDLSEDGKFLNIYNTLNFTDSVSIKITATDSSENTLAIEKKILFNAPQTDTIKKLIMKVLPKENSKINPDLVATITFNKPVKDFKTDAIEILEDSANKIQLTYPADLEWNNYKTVLYLKKRLNAQDSIKLIIKKHTFLSIQNDTNQYQELNYKIKKETNYGLISGNFKTDETHYTIQLLDQKFKVIDTIQNKPSFQFSYIKPGSYQIRVLIDDNNNGKWDKGNYENRALPEPVIFYDETIMLRANWEILDINFEYIDNVFIKP